MATEHITHTNQDGIAVIRFNRADKKNALTQAMYDAMREALESAAADPAIRVAVFVGQPDCFCAGNDLADFLNTPPGNNDSPVARFMRALAGFEKPVLAAPAGVAVGIGVTMLLHCDLVYCGAQTKLHMPFVNLGICPEFASSYILPRLVGHQRAAELLLLGEPFNAEKALTYGLVNEVLPNAEVESRALARAAQIAALPPQAVRTTKMLLKKWSSAVTTDSIDVEGRHFMAMLRGAESLEAISAFMQKRKPDFSRFQ